MCCLRGPSLAFSVANTFHSLCVAPQDVSGDQLAAEENEAANEEGEGERLCGHRLFGVPRPSTMDMQQ